MLKDNLYPFTAVVGQEEAKKALLIALVNRRAGGLLIGGAKGTQNPCWPAVCRV